MDFASFKSKKDTTSTREELQVELSILESSLSGLSGGDLKIIEKKIIKIQGKIELLETTVAGDIAQVTTNFFTDCSNDDKCECGKCSLLRRKDINENKEFTPFGGFFGG